MQTNRPSNATPIPILHLVHWPRSGITSFLKSLINFSDRDSFEHRIAFFLAEEQELQWFADHCESAVDLEYSKNPLSALRRLNALVNETAGTVVHSHSFQPGVWGRLFHQQNKVGFMSTVHSPYPYLLKNSMGSFIKAEVEQFSINQVNHPVVAISEAVHNHLLDHTRIRPQKIDVISNGLDTHGVSPNALLDPRIKEQIGLEPGDRMVIAVARLSHEKGVDVLLQAWKILQQNNSGLKLVIVGDGSELKTLEILSDDLGIQESVFFAGFQADVNSWFSGADLFVNPSRFEGLGMSILEALLVEVPVVATAVGGVPEVIRDGINGTLVESENPEALAAAMELALAHPEQSQKMAEAGRLHVLEKYDIRNTVKSYEDIYRQVHCGLDCIKKETR